MRLSAILSLLLLTSCTHAEKLDQDRLKLPAGFHISVFGKATEPRMMVFSPGGVLLVSDTHDNKVLAFPDPKHTGTAESSVTVVEGLREPHGLAFRNGKLYVAETHQVQRFDWDEASLKATNGKVLTPLSTGGGHSTRTVLFYKDKMYVSDGSSCNLCLEKDSHRATVLEFNDDGTGEKIFARGVRNTVGMAINPKTDTIWGTNNERDRLGDDLPPDKINDLGSGGDFGWPYCYGDRIPDPDAPKGGDKPGPERCKGTIPPKVALQAHSAPLGLAFYEGNMFPAEYKGDMFVALHGSWNRSIPTGYKIIRVRMDDKGEPKGVEDFITGWLKPGETKHGVWMGRPVGIVFAADGSMYISDDAAGLIYRVTWAK